MNPLDPIPPIQNYEYRPWRNLACAIYDLVCAIAFRSLRLIEYYFAKTMFYCEYSYYYWKRLDEKDRYGTVPEKVRD